MNQEKKTQKKSKGPHQQKEEREGSGKDRIKPSDWKWQQVHK